MYISFCSLKKLLMTGTGLSMLKDASTEVTSLCQTPAHFLTRTVKYSAQHLEPHKLQTAGF